MTAEELAQRFHEIYERRAPEFGYSTRQESAKPWDEIPAENKNKRLMIAVCGDILALFEERNAALEQLALGQRAYLLSIAPHSYLEGNRAAPLREAWQALGLDTPPVKPEPQQEEEPAPEQAQEQLV